MIDWLDEMAGPGYSQAVLWTLLALLLLVVLLVILKLVGTLRHGTFVAGGRNRKARLAVSDATAVDGHRRLVLVRRDDVEHLLLIGGSSDIVVEQDIRIGQPRRAPAPVEREAPAAPPPVSVPAQPVAAPPPAAMRTRNPEPNRPQPPARPAPERASPPVARPAETRTHAARSGPARGHHNRADAQRVETGAEARQAAPPPAPEPRAAPAPALVADDLDSALLKELEVSLDGDERSAGQPKPSLDDEMARLLGELSNPRR